jgi:hypothetical protein
MAIGLHERAAVLGRIADLDNHLVLLYRQTPAIGRAAKSIVLQSELGKLLRLLEADALLMPAH